jgi:hypothetical protein
MLAWALANAVNFLVTQFFQLSSHVAAQNKFREGGKIADATTSWYL